MTGHVGLVGKLGSFAAAILQAVCTWKRTLCPWSLLVEKASCGAELTCRVTEAAGMSSRLNQLLPECSCHAAIPRGLLISCNIDQMAIMCTLMTPTDQNEPGFLHDHGSTSAEIH